MAEAGGSGGMRGQVALAVVGVVATAIVEWATGWVGAVLALLGAHLTGRADVPVWLLYLLGAGCLGLVGLGVVLWLASREGTQPEYLTYTRDKFYGVLWLWRYGDGGVRDIAPICPDCETVLVGTIRGDGFYEDYSTELRCEPCGRTLVHEPGRDHDLIASVRRRIERNVRVGEWPGRERQPVSAPGGHGGNR